MKQLVLALATASLALSTGSAFAEDRHGGAHKMFTADKIPWATAPATLPKGAQAAVLYGDPAKAGPFAMRLKLPKDFMIPPHTHPRPEVVTVLSGTVHIGTGKTVEMGKASTLTAGSFFAFEPGMVHYGHAAEEAVLQINSTGPWSISYVNPADDPRKK